MQFPCNLPIAYSQQDNVRHQDVNVSVVLKLRILVKAAPTLQHMLHHKLLDLTRYTKRETREGVEYARSETINAVIKKYVAQVICVFVMVSSCMFQKECISHWLQKALSQMQGTTPFLGHVIVGDDNRQQIQSMFSFFFAQFQLPTISTSFQHKLTAYSSVWIQ